jgi:hypothetical protein
MRSLDVALTLALFLGTPVGISRAEELPEDRLIHALRMQMLTQTLSRDAVYNSSVSIMVTAHPRFDAV